MEFLDSLGSGGLLAALALGLLGLVLLILWAFLPIILIKINDKLAALLAEQKRTNLLLVAATKKRKTAQEPPKKTTASGNVKAAPNEKKEPFVRISDIKD
jgi:hypothetical protein